MATQVFQRQLSQVIAAFSGVISSGFVYETGNKFYLPLTYDNFSSPNFTPAVNCTAGQSRLNAVTAGSFDNLRVGDVVTSLSGAGELTAKATIDRTCYAVKGKKMLIYPSSFTSSTLGVKAGDAVSGATANVIPANTVVDKIDYENFTIYLNNVVGSAGDATDVITFAPPARITAVRKSTATSGANQVDIDTTVSVGGSGLTATIVNGAAEAVFAVLRVEPIDNTTGSRATFNVGVSILTGSEVVGSANGLNNIDVANITYIAVGSFSFDGDTFLVNSRLPRPVSA